MVVIDEKLEAIARIRMAINNDIQARQIQSEGKAEEVETNNESSLHKNPQWQFGSPEGKIANLQVLLKDNLGIHREYHDLDQRLRDFIAFHFPEEALSYEEDIFVSSLLLIL